MIITAMAGALILASTPPKPAPPPPPPPPRPQSGSGPHIKVFDGTSDQGKPGTPPAPSGGLAPATRPPTPLLPAIQMPRDSAPAPRPK
ncbi:MAG: hypothetical protein K9G59_02015 [Caulobacter sp.]|nr:hypothetical protein [Caulobacter sp.]